MYFKKKKILVSGSEGFLAKEMRKNFVKNGASFYGLDLKKINKSTIECDITNEQQVKKVFDQNFNRSGLDILINNASINPGNIKKLSRSYFKFSDYDLDIWEKSLRVDLVGSFLLSKYALKIFEKKGTGTIINISSIYGMIGPDQSLYGNSSLYKGYKPIEYSVAKAGLIGFTKSLAAYYSRSNIKIICLILGGIDNNFSNKFKNKYKRKTIQGRMGNIDEIMNYVNFYASNKSSYSSGNCIVIDGGATSII